MELVELKCPSIPIFYKPKLVKDFDVQPWPFLFQLVYCIPSIQKMCTVGLLDASLESLGL